MKCSPDSNCSLTSVPAIFAAAHFWPSTTSSLLPPTRWDRSFATRSSEEERVANDLSQRVGGNNEEVVDGQKCAAAKIAGTEVKEQFESGEHFMGGTALSGGRGPSTL